MRGYNLYYHGQKINKTVLSKDEKDAILQHTNIYKKQQNGVQAVVIPTKNIEVVECIII